MGHHATSSSTTCSCSHHICVHTDALCSTMYTCTSYTVRSNLPRDSLQEQPRQLMHQSEQKDNLKNILNHKVDSKQFQIAIGTSLSSSRFTHLGQSLPQPILQSQTQWIRFREHPTFHNQLYTTLSSILRPAFQIVGQQTSLQY